MFDAHNKQEVWDRFEKSGSDEADRIAQPGTEEANERCEDMLPRQPRVFCVGFAVFRV